VVLCQEFWKQILTGEQFEKWQKQREKMRDQARERSQQRK